MAKPIFIVTLPGDTEQSTMNTIQHSLQSKMTDFHVLVVVSGIGAKELKFEAFFEKDFNEVKFEELKNIVKESMKK